MEDTLVYIPKALQASFRVQMKGQIKFVKSVDKIKRIAVSRVFQR